jgi:DNA-binding LacI/PurR family transcriptional regulator
MNTTLLRSNPTLGRPADRANHIVRELRSEIVSGQLSPGHQLATRPEIERRFAASSVTVQRALEQLRRDGFIVVNGRQGTYVTQNPPHLTNYVLAFASHPAAPGDWTRFMTALANETLVLQQSQNYKIDIYYNINGHADSQDFQKLLREVEAHRIAGIIFASNPYMVERTLLLEESGIQRVAIMAGAQNMGWPAVTPDFESFWERATQYLASRGHKRVAVLMPSGLDLNLMRQPIEEYIAAAGLSTRPEWKLAVHLAAPESARSIIHLLMSERQVERPDALIIGDDNFMEHATGGLVDAGARVPEDIEVVAHCNYPYSVPSVVPVKRLGYDVCQVVKACIENIDRQRGGEEVLPVTYIPAQFEEEVR